MLTLPHVPILAVIILCNHFYNFAQIIKLSATNKISVDEYEQSQIKNDIDYGLIGNITQNVGIKQHTFLWGLALASTHREANRRKVVGKMAVRILTF